MTPLWARGIFLISLFNLLAIAWCHWDNLKDSEGVDRVTWLLAINIPIMGVIAYFFIGIPQRVADHLADPDSWKKLLK